jgi:hypothetical protein
LAISIASFYDHVDNDDGYCTTCADWTALGGCEPDARNYRCDECDKKTVFGAQEALLMGLIEIGEGEEDQTGPS